MPHHRNNVEITNVSLSFRMKKTFVIGDIHGGLRALIQVLKKATVSKADTLIFLGDYVDGWSESAQVLEYVMQLSKKQCCMFIKGNHDLWCEEWLQTGDADLTWLYYGGEETVKSFEHVSETNKKKLLLFLQQMPYFYIDENNNLFIHAGFASSKGPQKEFEDEYINWDRSLWESALAADKKVKKTSLFFPRRLKLFKEIYIGHTPTLYFDSTEPMNACNVWNIDTGAAFTGRLSIMNINTKEFWQSDPLQQLYPGEEGRNKV